MEPYYGIGVRFKWINNSLSNNENDLIKPIGDNGTNKTLSQAGKFIYPNFDLGFKICYQIK